MFYLFEEVNDIYSLHVLNVVLFPSVKTGVLQSSSDKFSLETKPPFLFWEREVTQLYKFKEGSGRLCKKTFSQFPGSVLSSLQQSVIVSTKPWAVRKRD